MPNPVLDTLASAPEVDPSATLASINTGRKHMKDHGRMKLGPTGTAPVPDLAPAIAQATQQVLKNYGDTVVPHPSSIRPDQGPKGLEYIAKIESGGKYSAVNPRSGALGKYQFMPATLRGYGVDPNAFLADPQLQEQVAQRHYMSIVSGLQKAGVPVTDKTVYASWQQGLKGFTDMYYSRGSTPTKNLAMNLPQGIEPTRENWLNYWMR